MRRLNVTLEGLIALVTAAQEGNLERGGKTLGLTPSAAGKQISTLEKAVGAKLFQHKRGRWVLNEEGKLLVPEAFQTIFHARMGVDLVRAHVRLRTASPVGANYSVKGVPNSGRIVCRPFETLWAFRLVKSRAPQGRPLLSRRNRWGSGL